MSLRLLFGASVLIFAVILVALSLRPKRVGPFPPPTDWQPAVSGAKACPDAYKKIFSQPTIDILVSFGYKDARPARFVGDRYERATFVSSLLARCPKDFHACEFTRNAEDGDLFEKKVVGPSGEVHTVRLRVTPASAGPDDDENRTDTYQTWLSRYAQRELEEGLARKNVVLYNGHSRAGGGPDFSPPRLTKQGRGTDYYWYQVQQPGIKRILKALQEKETSVQLLGLYSCVSSKHFSNAIWKEKPTLALISSRELLYYADALRNLSGTLTAVLGMWCEPDFGSAISAEPVGGKTSLARFFAQ